MKILIRVKKFLALPTRAGLNLCLNLCQPYLASSDYRDTHHATGDKFQVIRTTQHNNITAGSSHIFDKKNKYQQFFYKKS